MARYKANSNMQRYLARRKRAQRRNQMIAGLLIAAACIAGHVFLIVYAWPRILSR